jgi:hypothetical protein
MKLYTSLILLVALGCSVDAGSSLETEESESNLAAGTYVLQTRTASGKCMDVAAAGTADGTNIQQWACNGTPAQSFRVEDLGDGNVKLVNTHANKCVDVAGGSTARGANIQLWTCNGTAAQTFRLVDMGNGYVRIKLADTKRCLEVAGSGTADGTNIRLWSCGTSSGQYFRPISVTTTTPTTTTPTTTTPTTTTPTTSGLPARIVAGYYPNWTPSPVRIRDVNSNYNLIYLFAAQPVGGAPGTTGAVFFDLPGDGRGAASNFNADIQYARTTQGRKIILSVGGAGSGMSFPTRSKSETFVNSIAQLYARFGGFDGLDWNTFEADQAPDTSEMIWMSLELKRRFPGFIISAPPAPWNSRDKTFCADMVRAGAMDYAAPQYYDGPGLDVQAYIVSNVSEWVSLLGPSKVVVGFGIWNQTNYMSVAEAMPTWNQLESLHPTLRGGFNWQIHTDEAQGWQFANQVGPLIKQ